MTIEQIISCDRDVQGGTVVFAATRVPLRNLFDYLKAGDSLGEFLDDFPSVTREQAIAALELAPGTGDGGASRSTGGARRPYEIRSRARESSRRRTG